MKIELMRPEDWPLIEPHLKDEEWRRLVAVQEPDLNKPMLFYVIRLEDSGIPVGWIELFNIDQMNNKAEVGISIPDRRGRGWALIAGRTFARDIAFGAMGLNRLTARVLAVNKHAIRCAERFGFQVEGVERQGHINAVGQAEDVVLLGLLKEDFLKGGGDAHGGHDGLYATGPGATNNPAIPTVGRASADHAGGDVATEHASDVAEDGRVHAWDRQAASLA